MFPSAIGVATVSVRHWPRMFGILHTVQEQQQVAVWLPERAAAAAMCDVRVVKMDPGQRPPHRIARCWCCHIG
jgi:hypothetical protein